jgi:Mitochondrial small ribosomal subunit Rsm22
LALTTSPACSSTTTRLWRWITPRTASRGPSPAYRELEGDAPINVLVLSHVLNELDAAAQAQLAGLLRRAGTILWVEPGTHEVSRALGAWRERLRPDFRIFAPCTHGGACGALAAGNERHWCHFFASPPPEIFADSAWVKFGQRAGIDLRSLPYSYLVLSGHAAKPAAAPGQSRVIGEPRLHKGYAKIFNCDLAGVRELTLQKRDAPDFFKSLKRGEASPLQSWRIEGERIIGIEPN